MLKFKNFKFLIGGLAIVVVLGLNVNAMLNSKLKMVGYNDYLKLRI